MFRNLLIKRNILAYQIQSKQKFISIFLRESLLFRRS